MSIFSSFVFDNVKNQFVITNSITLDKKDVSTLAKSQHVAISLSIGPLQYFHWSFSSSNPSISIKVCAFTPSSYEIFKSDSGFSGTILSDGTKTSDSGDNELLNKMGSATLYIVFINEDTDNQSTTLTYTAYVMFSLEFYELIIMIIVFIALSIVGVVLLIKKIKNREKYAYSDFEKEEKRKKKVKVDEIDMMRIPDSSELDQKTYEILETMSCNQIISFLKDSKKDISDPNSLREINIWMKKLKKYPHTTLYEQDLKKLVYKFSRW
ncbi:MAG: hypothetical protein EAX96_08545 [Candidatus Lokiarchaeota archaeon]|nr:hypothetical protein [Candidatus Lokiarchaeota archaeon]